MVFALALVAGAQLVVRVGTVDITPPEPLPLGGYTERGGQLMEPGGEPLLARAVQFEHGELRIRIVSAEMLTIPESLRREVRSRLPQDVKLFLTATHTHSAPDSQMLNERMTMAVPGIATFRRQWLDWYAGRIAHVQLGLPNRIDALAVSFLDPGLNRGRRIAADPDPLASRVDVLVKPDRWAQLLLHYSAHAIVHGPANFRTHGDWPGAVAARAGVPVLIGPIGDVSPAGDGDAEGRLRQFVDQLAGRKFGSPFQLFKAGDPVKWHEEPVDLPPVVPHPEFAQRYNVPPALASLVVGAFAPREASVSAFRLGKLAVVGIPGEPTSHIGRRIRDYGRRIGFRHVLVVSHVNGWIGYILDPVDYDRGGYEATLSFHGRETGMRVAEAAEEALEALRGHAPAPSSSRGKASTAWRQSSDRVGPLRVHLEPGPSGPPRTWQP